MSKKTKAINFDYDDYYSLVKNRDFSIPDYKISGGKKIINKKILVLGSGTARDIRYLVKSNYITAIDNSSEAIAFLKKIGINAVKHDLNEPLDFGDKSFDLIIAKDVLEHVYNPTALAGEIYRLLSTSGYAVINVPNHFYYWMRIRLMFGKSLVWKTIIHDHTEEFKEWDYMHKVFFTWSGFRKFLKQNKLRIVRSYFDLGTLNHYSDPKLVEMYLKQGNNRLYYVVFSSFSKLFNIIFPISLRSKIASISPGLLCASFYVWCKAERNEK